MNWSTIKRRFYKHTITITLFFIIALSQISHSQQTPNQNNCLNLQTILNLLDRGVDQNTVINEIQRFGVDFKLDWRTAVSLARAGANDDLLDSIDTNICCDFPINFNNWWPYGGIIVARADDGSYIIANGQLNAFSGVTTTDYFQIENRQTLKITIEGSDNSSFNLDQRMLKVFMGPNQQAILCDDINARSRDPEYIFQRDGEFNYTIPDNLVSDGRLNGLGISFGPGNINGIQISGCFE